MTPRRTIRHGRGERVLEVGSGTRERLRDPEFDLVLDMVGNFRVRQRGMFYVRWRNSHSVDSTCG